MYRDIIVQQSVITYWQTKQYHTTDKPSTIESKRAAELKYLLLLLRASCSLTRDRETHPRCLSGVRDANGGERTCFRCSNILSGIESVGSFQVHNRVRTSKRCICDRHQSSILSIELLLLLQGLVSLVTMPYRNPVTSLRRIECHQ